MKARKARRMREHGDERARTAMMLSSAIRGCLGFSLVFLFLSSAIRGCFGFSTNYDPGVTALQICCRLANRR